MADFKLSNAEAGFRHVSLSRGTIPRGVQYSPGASVARAMSLL
jgi:hypothetical protein